MDNFSEAKIAEHEQTFITLRCFECDNTQCDIAAPIVHSDSKKGCTRLVSQEIADEYYYLTEEKYPFILENDRLSLNDKTVAANNLLDWLDKNIYSSAIGKQLD